ncbi:MAG TPA: hypothetical protein PKW33_17455 [Anaerolineaceae bacterium]|nr:hypothetical protein [Anaerolineaceae bacterium]HPN53388.1 hypothetical protein [Anaerolineaceae bacterium]
MDAVALIIIYNHQYNKNIEILEQIYKDRFSHIYHLVPFYQGEKNNVIPVYENSLYFQGYVAQGLKSFFKQEFCHYIFIADDLILNPALNESNYQEILHLKEHTCFLPGFISLHECREDQWWQRVSEAFHYRVNVFGIEANNQIPSYDEALKKFENNHLEIKPLSFYQIWKRPVSFVHDIKRMLRDKQYLIAKLKYLTGVRDYHLSYPVVGSYSDIFVVSSDAIKPFCHFCGVFAATRLHVEVGLPTALVLSAQEIVTEEDLKLKGKALWDRSEYKILDRYEYKLSALLAGFPENLLYLHPIKLSKWNIDYE